MPFLLAEKIKDRSLTDNLILRTDFASRVNPQGPESTFIHKIVFAASFSESHL